MTRDERDLWADAAWMARCARGSSWPADMAQRVEDAADRVIAHEAALRATPADDPGEHGNISCPKCGSHDVTCSERPHNHVCHGCGYSMLPAPAESVPDCGLSWCENHAKHAPPADRIDLTILNGELFDAHQHQPGDREGDGPFVNLDSKRLSPGGKGHKHRIEANGYLVVVTVTPVEPTAPRPPARSHGGHR